MDVQTLAAALAIGERRKANLVAPEYDATSTYEIGAIVMYKGTMYECTTTISTAEAWNADHWTKRTLSSNYLLIQLSTGSARFRKQREHENQVRKRCTVTAPHRVLPVPTPSPPGSVFPGRCCFAAESSIARRPAFPRFHALIGSFSNFFFARFFRSRAGTYYRREESRGKFHDKRGPLLEGARARARSKVP